MSDIRKIQTGNNQYTLHARVSDKLAGVATYITRNQINYPWHRIATSGTLTVRNYDDFNVVLCITEHGPQYGFGIIKINLRKNNTNVSIADATWLLRFKFNIDDIQLGLRNTAGDTYLDVFIKLKILWQGGVVYKINEGNSNAERDLYKFITSEEVLNTTATNKLTSIEVYKTIEEAATQLHGKAYTSIIKPTDSGTVANAGYAEKIGTNKSHPQIGSPTKPVYVDSSGYVRACSRDIPAVDTAMSATSTNPVQNKAVVEALKLKADVAALDKYQPKHSANYVAKEDLTELPITDGVIDLNSYTLTISNVESTGDLTIVNGTIMFTANSNLEITSLVLDNITISNSADEIVTLKIQDYLRCFNVTDIDGGINFTSTNSSIREVLICNSNIHSTLPITETLNAYNSTCYINGSVKLTAYNSFIGEDGLELNNGSVWYNTQLDISPYYNSGWIDEAGKVHCGMYFDESITANSDYAPQTKVVYEALQLKADKTQLNSLATKTELSSKADKTQLNNYVTTTTANSTYAKKSDITNIYKFKGTKTNYADLPTTNRVTGDVWNITNADAEHGIKAGDNVAWNDTAWDNLSGTVDLSAYATTTTTDAMSADIKKLMDKAFPFTVKVSIDKTIAKKGTSQPVKVTITPKIGDDNTDADEIMINGAEYHGATPYVHSTTATTTTTYNVRADKTGRNSARGSATITFVNPSYDGAVAANFTVTEANIKALTETLRSEKGGTRTFNLNNQKACIAYPKAFGAATGIKDANGFDYLASYTRSELNVNGELYYVYLLTNAATITDFKQTIS